MMIKSLAFAIVLLTGLLAGAVLASAQERLATGAQATVQPGDQIALRIDREPAMSDTFPVDERGEVVLPRVGVVRAADMSAGTLQDTLRVAFSRYLRNPVIQVTVLRRVAVQGDVREPGLYRVDLTTTLPDVLALAGGLTETANPKRVEIIRGGTRLRVPHDGATVFTAAELRSGDRIVVGRRSWLARNPNAVIGTFSGVVGLFIAVTQLVRSK